MVINIFELGLRARSERFALRAAFRGWFALAVRARLPPMRGNRWSSVRPSRHASPCNGRCTSSCGGSGTSAGGSSSAFGPAALEARLRGTGRAPSCHRASSSHRTIEPALPIVILTLQLFLASGVPLGQLGALVTGSTWSSFGCTVLLARGVSWLHRFARWSWAVVLVVPSS